jgi:hypothetical protein
MGASHGSPRCFLVQEELAHFVDQLLRQLQSVWHARALDPFQKSRLVAVKQQLRVGQFAKDDARHGRLL